MLHLHTHCCLPLLQSAAENLKSQVLLQLLYYQYMNSYVNSTLKLIYYYHRPRTCYVPFSEEERSCRSRFVEVSRQTPLIRVCLENARQFCAVFFT
jgi:hypothetical protein